MTITEILPGFCLVRVADDPSVAMTRRIAAFVHALENAGTVPISEIIASYTTVLFCYDHTVLYRSDAEKCISEAWVASDQTAALPDLRTVEIDVVYGDTFGDDLADVAGHNGLTVDDVIRLHVETTYHVGAVGFTPGFAYLLGLPPELATPRRSVPRTRVPAGSVGIGGAQTGVYALESAGGWNLIGRSPTRLFRADGVLDDMLRPGDRVRFRQIEASAWRDFEAIALPSSTANPSVEILDGGFQSTIQDAGRIGYGSYGFARNGAMDLASMRAANVAVGNEPETSVVEMALAGITLRAHRRLRLALAGARMPAEVNGVRVDSSWPIELMPGDTVAIGHAEAGSGLRGYLAVNGGWDVPAVLGSTSTDMIARMGGMAGRPLQVGDVLAVHPPTSHARGGRIAPRQVDTSAIRVVPGAHQGMFAEDAWNTLLGQAFTVSSDASRMGIRFDGPSLAPAGSADIVSEPLVTGAIQVPGESGGIVMLPGHATIGGYACLATVIEDDWNRLGQLAPGDEIRFTSLCRTS